MPDFLKKLLTSSFVTAQAMALVRHIATGGGIALMGWLAKHNVDPTQAQGFVEYLIGAIVTGAGILWSQIDVANVGTKMKTSADAGAAIVQRAVTDAQLQGEDVQRAADQARADAVNTAITVADTKAKNATVDDMLAQMRAGGA